MNEARIYGIASVKGFGENCSSLRVRIERVDVEAGVAWVMTADLRDAGTRLVLDFDKITLIGEVETEEKFFGVTVTNIISTESAEYLVDELRSRFAGAYWFVEVGACPVGGSFDVVVTTKGFETEAEATSAILNSIGFFLSNMLAIARKAQGVERYDVLFVSGDDEGARVEVIATNCDDDEVDEVKAALHRERDAELQGDCRVVVRANSATI